MACSLLDLGGQAGAAPGTEGDSANNLATSLPPTVSCKIPRGPLRAGQRSTQRLCTRWSVCAQRVAIDNVITVDPSLWIPYYLSRS